MSEILLINVGCEVIYFEMYENLELYKVVS